MIFFLNLRFFRKIWNSHNRSKTFLQSWCFFNLDVKKYVFKHLLYSMIKANDKILYVHFHAILIIEMFFTNRLSFNLTSSLFYYLFDTPQHFIPNYKVMRFDIILIIMQLIACYWSLSVAWLFAYNHIRLYMHINIWRYFYPYWRYIVYSCLI